MSFPAGANLSRMRACWIFPVRIAFLCACASLLENVLRRATSEQQAGAPYWCIVDAGLAGGAGGEIEFMPARVLFQDFTGVPRIR